MDNLITRLYQTNKTVFSNKDLAIIWQETNSNNLKSKIAYYVKTGSLIRLTKGIFAKDQNYNRLELACRIYSPSYISFETVLREQGVIFQYYQTIFVAGPRSKTVKIAESEIKFRKLKNSLLYNPGGVDNKDDVNKATLERAFLDTVYLFPQYYFDNLSSLNWEKCFELAKIYQNQQLLKRLKNYQKNYA